MYFTEGIVIAIIPRGFRIATTWGSEQDVHTMTSGRELDLAVGDRVVVHGGPTPDGAFATSSISLTLATGETVEVPDQPKSSAVRQLRTDS